MDASLRAFEAGAAGDAPRPEVSARSEAGPQGPARLLAQWNALEARLAKLPAPVREMAEAGLRHVVDFQDPAYGTEYLDRLDRVVAADGGDYAFSVAAAKYIANAMAYDDVIRVADLKTRRTRFDRVRREMGLEAGDVAHITEFMRPRVEELCSVMPAWLGAWIEARPWRARWIDRRINRGRRVRTDGVLWFGALYLARRRKAVAARHAPPPGRDGASGALARARTGDGAAGPRARGGDRGLPSADQGLFRHARAAARPSSTRCSPHCLCWRGGPMRPTGSAGCARQRFGTRRAKPWRAR